MSVHDTTMTVECRTCPVRELQCGDCMVPVLLELTAPSARVDLALDPEERAAVTRLVEAGLVGPDAAARARAVGATTGALDDVRLPGGRAVG
ncbi:MAG TPA: hypothetical protein VES93_11985 [Ornithinibacter sp.]|nr:hypothetical protein [Ornithinibacter sp.]